MAVAAEQILEMSYAIPEQVADQALRRKAAYFIGRVAMHVSLGEQVSDQLETDEALDLQPIESLHDAIQAASQGDIRGYKLIETNVMTDVSERTIKSGHIVKVELKADASGGIRQHGQTLQSVQANSLRFAADNPQMRRRVEAETRNTFRLEHYYDNGTLQDYYFVTFSRAADDMTSQQMQTAGFFTDTMSCAIQVTSAKGDQLTMESAFVAGTKQPGTVRHDGQAIEQLVANLGLDIAGMGATELLDTPLLIHKNLMPDGVMNLVEHYDDCAGATFFGEAKPRLNYIAYKQTCAERQAGFQPKVDQIVQELIAEAPRITSPVMATERLNALSGKHMVELAAQDTSINSQVFGTAAAARIEMARWHLEQGNASLAQEEITEAIKVEQSGSCPSGKQDINISPLGNESSDCKFISKECPLCHKKDVITTVKKVGDKKHISGSCGCSKTVKADT